MKFSCILLTMLLFAIPKLQAQPLQDSSADSSIIPVQDTMVVMQKKTSAWDTLLQENKWLNAEQTTEIRPEQKRNPTTNNGIFYYLLGVAALLAFNRKMFDHFFNNIYRIFFNLTLRQKQIREQLMQARLPNIMYDLFFILVFGLLLYFLIFYDEPTLRETNWLLLLVCTLAVFVLYIVKMLVLNFMGWLTGYKTEMRSYGFAIFLINKVTAMFLFPIVLLLSVASGPSKTVAVIIALSLFALSYLVRYLRGYNIFSGAVKVSPLTFIFYLFMLELLPLALIYKFTTTYFDAYL